MGRIRLSAAGTTSCLPFLRRKLLLVVYCLTVRKDLPTDRRIFKYYIPKRKNLASKLIWPLIPAIQGNFPNTRAQGWFFHFCQAVLRQVGRLGLRTDYMNNQEVRKKVKVLMALAFLPVHLVPTGFEIINVGTSGQVEALFQYFQQEWLPATKIPLWNIHGVSVRTNNHLEGWHSRMNKSARKHHLGFYQFLQLILDEQGKTVLVMRQIDDGCTHGRGSVRRSAAYGVQQRRVAALTSRLVHNEISVQQILSAQSYHTPEPLRLYACGEKQKYLCAKQSAD
ncbi:conserved hypothetical protein [Trichinella spiralis]|uniref:hypothetical protein n=1 Tax=Trichinella spiralis TaxID=6334 RepID=UPI0001EFD411|nr:conserved hypothetical protein [Trichinella spiralis]